MNAPGEGLEDVRVEVVPAPGQTGNLTGAPLRERLADRIGELADVVNDMAENLRQRIQAGLDPDTGAWGLDAVDMEFSVQLEAGTGVLIAQASTTGAFAVTLSFRRKAPLGE